MIRKHPLFWKEWKSAKWWSFLINVVLVIMFLSINNNLQYMKKLVSGKDSYGLHTEGIYLDNSIVFEGYYSNALVGAALAILPIVVIMTTLLFQSDRKEKVGAFISSLPFTKKEQFKVKWFVGLKVITIPFAITLILTLVMRVSNWAWIQGYYTLSDNGDKMMTYDTLAAVILTLLQVYLFFMAFYSLLMLVQTLIGNNIAASVIGVIVLAVPWFVIETGKTSLSRLLDYQINIYNHQSWSLFYTLMLPARNYIEVQTTRGLTNISVFSYDYYWLKVIIMLLVIGLSLYGGINFYGCNDNSRNGQLVMFDWVRKTLIIGFTICAALLGNNEFRILFIKNTNPVYEIATLAISGLIGYMIIQKVLKLTGGVQDD